MEQLCSHRMDFHENFLFSKISRENSSFVNVGKEKKKGALRENRCTFFFILQVLLEWEMIRTEAVDEIRWTYCSLYAILANSKDFPIGINTTIDLKKYNCSPQRWRLTQSALTKNCAGNAGCISDFFVQPLYYLQVPLCCASVAFSERYVQ